MSPSCVTALKFGTLSPTCSTPPPPPLPLLAPPPLPPDATLPPSLPALLAPLPAADAAPAPAAAVAALAVARDAALDFLPAPAPAGGVDPATDADPATVGAATTATSVLEAVSLLPATDSFAAELGLEAAEAMVDALRDLALPTTKSYTRNNKNRTIKPNASEITLLYCSGTDTCECYEGVRGGMLHV